MEAQKKNDNTPSPEELKKTQRNTYDEKNTVGSRGDGGGVGASREAWGGELPPPREEQNEQHAETD